MKKENVLKAFETTGLLVRSVQAHKPELFPTDYTAPTGPNLNGVARQCFSVIHKTIGQPIFQMAPVDSAGQVVGEAGNRGFALLLNWPDTWDRIIDVSTQDVSSGATFGTAHKVPTNQAEVTKQMAAFIKKAAAGPKTQNNEVRMIQPNNESLVGFIWAPSKPSPLNKVKPTWPESKALFTAYAKAIRGKGTNPVTRKTFHVFTYSLPSDGGMALNFLDTISF